MRHHWEFSHARDVKRGQQWHYVCSCCGQTGIAAPRRDRFNEWRTAICEVGEIVEHNCNRRLDKIIAEIRSRRVDNGGGLTAGEGGE